MTYVIAEPCIDECPVDFIDEGAQALYVHPGEGVDCGAGEPGCPVETPLNSPGGAAELGTLGVDIALVGGRPPRA